ncbi:hypothetical protein [Nonomuraea sp. NPDC050691]|uniref:hypothetical protein n=1 Tax=Nonomuraea sp. NPDC050691 TaxID=3155661 RepID=UPI0034028F72
MISHPAGTPPNCVPRCSGAQRNNGHNSFEQRGGRANVARAVAQQVFTTSCSPPNSSSDAPKLRSSRS